MSALNSKRIPSGLVLDKKTIGEYASTIGQIRAMLLRDCLKASDGIEYFYFGR
ncbi:hypothetical protein JOC94_003169 [Bacillus thermophilus]|uniref:Uncharacterized protein n=1 Tax=Siminovitchia thermophila TaxID=1245522 RepID=A0ABS2RBD7_9BACI|nr:hypothetical protein [Siminovitchia thermophila]